VERRVVERVDDVLGEQLGNEFAAAGHADLVKITLMWSLTVWAEMHSSAATSLVDSPLESRRTTSVSRPVRP
jgi:hypothetical protein